MSDQTFSLTDYISSRTELQTIGLKAVSIYSTALTIETEKTGRVTTGKNDFTNRLGFSILVFDAMQQNELHLYVMM